MTTITKEYTFTNGTKADAIEVNKDFDDIYSAINGNLGAVNLANGIQKSINGVINVKDPAYNASGLATTAVGSITTGAKALTLTTTPDFVAGQGINLQGVSEVASLQVTGAATVSSNVTITLNGVAYPVAVSGGIAEVASLNITAPSTVASNVAVTLNGVVTNVAVLSTDTAINVADKIRAAVFAGWTTGGTVGTATVTFTANTVGVQTDATYSAGTTGAAGTMTTTTQGVNADTAINVADKIRSVTYAGWTVGGTAGTNTVTFASTTSGVKTDATYSAGTTGAAGTMTTTTQGTADQISTVASVSGLVVNIADNSTRTITAGTILHDDTAAIQAADIAAAVSGGIVYYPVTSAHYKVTGEIAVSSNVQHVSDGATIKQYTAGKAVFTITGKNNVTIKGLNIQNSRLGAGTTYYAAEHGIIITGTCSDINVEDNEFSNIGEVAVWAKTVNRLRIIRNKILSYSYGGVIVNGGCSRVNISGNSIEGCTNTDVSYGIAIGNDDAITAYSTNVIVDANTIKDVKAWNGLDCHGGEEIIFSNNIVTNCRRGLECVIGYSNSPTPYMKNVTIKGNQFIGTGYYSVNVGTYPESGIYIGGSLNGVTTYTAQNFIVEGNYITGFNLNLLSGSDGGISVNYINGFTINGNLIESNRIGINLTHQIANGIIDGNQIVDNVTYGISQFDATSTTTNVLIQNNRIGGSGLAGKAQSYGMIAYAASTCIVKNNDFRGTTNGGFDGTPANWGLIAFNDGTGYGTRKESLGAAAPTTGTWAVDDICWITNPSDGSMMGWICIVAGTPGTWEPFGIIGAVKIAAQVDSVAADVATLKTDFNALLAKLRTAKLMS